MTTETSDTITISALDIGDAKSVFIDPSDLVYASTITAGGVINTDSGDLYIDTDIVFRSDSGDVSLLEKLQEQQLQIAALTDMITEMVSQQNFDIDLDIETRIKKKRFIEKLSTK